MTRNALIFIASFGSMALLFGAFEFQHIGGLAPCKMCLWQRWPHAAAIVIGAILLFGAPRLLCWFGALAALATAGIEAYHAGVEWKFWAGPSSCSGGGQDLGALDGAALLSTEGPVTLVMCDEVVWSLMGLSMAGWNAVISLLLCLIWIAAARRAGA